MRLALLDAIAEDGADVLRDLLRPHHRALTHEEALQSARELAGRLEAILLAFCQRLEDDHLQLGRVAGDDGGGRRDDARLHLLERVEIRLHAEEALVGGELPEHDAEREDVRRAIHLGAADLLRGHVRELALEGAGLCLREAIGHLRDAEVDDLGVAVVRHEEVVRRDVAVDEAEELSVLSAELVGRVEAVRRVCAHAGRELHGDALASLLHAAHDLAEGLAVEVLHGDPVGVVVLAEIEDLRDVRVVDARGDAGLVEEHVDELIVLDEVRVDALDRDPLLKAAGPVHAGQVHARHAAYADLVDDAVATEEEGPRRLLGLLLSRPRGGLRTGARAGCTLHRRTGRRCGRHICLKYLRAALVGPAHFGRCERSRVERIGVFRKV